MFEFIIISVSSHTVSEAMPLFGTTVCAQALPESKASIKKRIKDLFFIVSKFIC